VCNSGEHFEQEECETDTLSDKWLKNCYDEGLKDNKTYIMCRKFTQDGEFYLYAVETNCTTLLLFYLFKIRFLGSTP